MVDYLIDILISIPCVLVALVIHELAHGFIAYKLGDPTAKLMGRLTLNPLKHLDPIGTVCMIFFRFGWARPVPINTRFFKKPRRDICLSALAGPMANLLLAFIGAFIYSLSIYLLSDVVFESANFLFYVCVAYETLLFNFIWLNIALAIFNLIPLPPLDGSRILLIWLPYRIYAKILRYEREISALFIVILLLDSRVLGGIFTKALSFLVNLIYGGMMTLFSLIF
ncbi:MAG: site-2 protease family protein [Clostridia bacterium]|nr:site-2 protease family protein [Clostridia bacterium]